MNGRLSSWFALLGVAAGVACTDAPVSAGAAGPSVPAEPSPGRVAADDTAANVAAPAAIDDGRVAVLVELFTSEGCSSCPPADDVLAALEHEQPVAGARVIPLALHVDYWDRLGWKDPFSSATATKRQSDYRALGAGSYTPQAVVDGSAESVGSKRAALEKLVGDAARRPHVAMGIGAATRRDPAGGIDVTVTIGALPSDASADSEAFVVLAQKSARITVPRGENAGSTLDQTAIARDIVVAGTAPLAGASLTATVTPPADVPLDNLRLVVFVQERASRRLLGAATRDLAAP